jgi:hypothetical protein
MARIRALKQQTVAQGVYFKRGCFGERFQRNRYHCPWQPAPADARGTHRTDVESVAELPATIDVRDGEKHFFFVSKREK